MSHFATKLIRHTWVRALHRPYACVTVKVLKLQPHVVLEVVDGSIGISKQGTTWVALEQGTQVVAEDRTVIEPTGTFYVSTESFDPFHLLMDVFREGVL